MGKPRKLPDNETMRRLYVEEGKTLKQIAAIYACAWESVRRGIRRAGIKARRSGPRTVAECTEKGCRKPVHKVFHKQMNCWYGRKCVYHRKLHYARLNRWLVRKHKNIPPEKWYWQGEVPLELRESPQYQKFLALEGEKEALRWARLAMKEVRNYLTERAKKENENRPR